MATLDCRYTVNDIDAGELELAPTWVERMHGDIADPTLLTQGGRREGYDLVMSQMVFEHVRSPEMAYRNIVGLLAPGGILVNFIPTLYALPFLLNRALPDRLSKQLLQSV